MVERDGRRRLDSGGCRRPWWLGSTRGRSPSSGRRSWTGRLAADVRRRGSAPEPAIVVRLAPAPTIVSSRRWARASARQGNPPCRHVDRARPEASLWLRRASAARRVVHWSLRFCTSRAVCRRSWGDEVGRSRGAGCAAGEQGAPRTLSRSAASTRVRPLGRVVAGVALAGAQEDRLVLHVVADASPPPCGDPGERAGAGVLDEPFGPADGRGAVLAAGAERARAVAPELARLGLLRGGARALRASGSRAARSASSVVSPPDLRELEQAVVELRDAAVGLR